MVKRTKKEFTEYNEFRDRPFSLKWGTAFAMDDLMKGVRENHQQAMKDNKLLKQMDRMSVDQVLALSFLQHLEVEIQLNLRDEYGRAVDLLVGNFEGEAYEDYFVFNDEAIYWEDVRNVKIKNFEKWFQVEIFDKREVATPKEKIVQDVEIIKDEFYQAFPEEIE